MPIQNISSIRNVSFKTLTPETKEVQPQKPKEIAEGKKKLALTLGALAVAGIAAAGIICHKRSNKAGEKVADCIIKTTKDSVDKHGNNISETFKNGKFFSKRTTILNADGSKRIKVNYANKALNKIIDIAADGTRTVS